MGTAFAFVHLLDYCQDLGLRFDLAPGSRLMDTGGYKGRSRAVPKDELHRLYERVLGVPADHVVNEYGMTEMGSQFYDSALRDAQMRPRTEATPIPALRQAQGRPFPRRGGRSETGRRRPRHKTVPPWVRTVIVDVETMQPAPKCVVGLLRHYDLANVDSVMAVQTDDLGIALEDGFEIVGRASGAEARGCSIAVDELLTRATGP